MSICSTPFGALWLAGSGARAGATAAAPLGEAGVPLGAAGPLG